jgi:hypothetical protein
MLLKWWSIEKLFPNEGLSNRHRRYASRFEASERLLLWALITHLCRCSYRARPWMVQEIILAKGITCFCGDLHSFGRVWSSGCHHLPGGIANSAVDRLGLFDSSSDHKIKAEAPTKNLTGPYNKTLRELLHGRVATPTCERKVRSTQTLEHAMKK